MKIVNALKEVHAAVATIAGIRCAGGGMSGLNACANVVVKTTIGTVEIGIAEDVEMIVENRCAGNGRSA